MRILIQSMCVAVVLLPLVGGPGVVLAAPNQPVEVTADKSLEWHQTEQVYVARGNAKAVRGDTTIEADLLTAHQRPKQAGKVATKNDSSSGDIDHMTAEGNVRVTDPLRRITGQHGVYDLDQHVAVLTGDNLKYETEKEQVTARDSLEYWEDKKIAVARGNALAVSGGRHVEADVLTAEFRDTAKEQTELWKLSADGHVVVVTETDIVRGDSAIYDVTRNVATIRGHVKIARQDGTQLSGDVGEVDFNSNQSRLMNTGHHGRVRALLAARPATSKKVVHE